MSNGKQNIIKVAVNENTAYVKIFGRATFNLAPDFKNFVERQMVRKLREVLVDFEECESVDSTFIGLITSLTIKYSVDGKFYIKLFNLNEHLIKIIKTLGLLDVICISKSLSDEDVKFSETEKTNASKKDIATTMLEAHKVLSNINEQNELEFKNVVDYLRKEVNLET